MSRASRLAAASAAVVVGLFAGCTSTSAGEPRPIESGSMSEAGSSEPERPRELRLDGENPCALVPESDWPRFEIEKPGKRGVLKQYQSPDCFYSNNLGSFSVTLVVTEGIEPWLDGSRSAEVEEIDPIEGFPAIALTIEIDPHGCDVAVDVAEGQYLFTTVRINGRPAELPEICDYAYALAESAMSTLVES